jgi:nitroreductase
MVRQFDARAIPHDVLDRILESGLHAPSAGFAQGVDLVVLDDDASVQRFFALVDPMERKAATASPPAAVVVVVADKSAYLRRYSEPDKASLSMHVEQGWPVDYWDLDAAMAAMLMLLAAVDEGLGGWFFGLFNGEQDVREWLRIPAPARPIGALAFGYPAADERRRGSPLTHRRRPTEEVVHRGGW